MKKFKTYFNLHNIRDPAYMVHRIAGRHIRDRAQKFFKGRMLDIGCGSKPKRFLVGDLVSEHIGLDHEECSHNIENIDLIGTAYKIPVEDDSFDCVLNTAVLEHLEEPQKALTEACRVLKPGGYALITAPFFWHLHEEPRDFYRYTKYALGHLLTSSGFEIQEIKPLSGFWVTFGSEFNYYINRFRRGILRHVIPHIIAFNNLGFLGMEKLSKPDEKWTWMYLVVARKK